MEKFSFELFADYFQFYLQDENADFDSSAVIWTDQTVEDLLAVTSGMIYVGTVRNMTVPITIEIDDDEPNEDFGLWE
ncbi:MAG: hypothetical protein H7Z37_06820, partial [Pyrinomonadaceae bacterium]|nr:hypothetical protein [Pyrinomonadaceae bacterium]